MRILISITLYIITIISYAGDFSVFEKDGYYGIKDDTGNVTVPPVYEKLGWSDGSSKIHNGVIGFRDKDLWGLITVRNKSLTGQKFYTIVPTTPNFYKASIKDKFSNRLSHGILDSKGNTVLSFNYFTIEPMGSNWLVSTFDGRNQRFGVVSFDNNYLVQPEYQLITESNGFYLCKKRNHKIDLFLNNGLQVELALDSLTLSNKGWLAFRDGYAGFISKSGNVIHAFRYKNFSVKDERLEPKPFPRWKIYQADTILLEWECDSLAVGKNQILIGYLNGAHHLILSNKALLENRELVLKSTSNSDLIVQNSKTREWSVLDQYGKLLVSGYDSITSFQDSYLGLKKTGWFILSKRGEIMNRLPYEQLHQGIKDQLIGKRNDHWGIIKSLNVEDVVYKYDSIVVTGKYYLISYLNRWGAMNNSGEWEVHSEYAEILAHGSLLIGRKGKGYTVFHDGKKVLLTTSRPIREIGDLTLLISEEGQYGLLNEYGEMKVYPEYDSIKLWTDHYELMKDSVSILMNLAGQHILKYEENYQRVIGYGEDYFAVLKDDRMGFVDTQGRLRISNRYDEVMPFNEGLAPISLRGKWGFIDKSEQIRVQPYYEYISPFRNGMSIVGLNDRYGLVDMGGKEVLELIWKSIRRLSTGNYIVQNMDDQFGLIDETGVFILRPAYDQLEDYGDQILVSNDHAWGVLDSSGQQIFKINHREIKIEGDYLMVVE